MPYPTPGFVVRQTFLELEEPGTQSVQRSNLVRSKSDTNIWGATRQPSKFGSEALRLYCEGQGGAAEAGGIVPGAEAAPPSSPPRPSSPRGVGSSSAAAGEQDPRTTVHLQQLPSEYSREELFDVLVLEGFGGSFNFVYLPMDLRTRTGNSYAFINFTDHDIAQRALHHFTGFTDWRMESPQVCLATWSEYCQGLDALIERYRNSPIMHEAVPDIYKPKLYEAGEAVPFPPPTKRIRMPRLRKMGKQSPPENAASVQHAGQWGGASDDVWFVDLVASQSATPRLRPGAWVPQDAVEEEWLRNATM